MSGVHMIYIFFFFNDTATTEIYTLSLHDALPISGSRALFPLGVSRWSEREIRVPGVGRHVLSRTLLQGEDRKSTRLNSSHANISYAVFCLKKKKNDSTTALA